MIALTPALALHRARARPNRNVPPSAALPFQAHGQSGPARSGTNLGQHQRQRLQIGADGFGIGEQAIGRDQRRHGRKYREQSEEHHAGGGGEQAVIIGAFIDAPQDLFPGCPGNCSPIDRGLATRSGIGFPSLFARRRAGLRDQFSGRTGLCSGLKKCCAVRTRMAVAAIKRRLSSGPDRARGIRCPFVVLATAVALPPSPARSPP